MHFEERVFHYIDQYHMIQEGESVIAGVSGGADSVCLFFCLLHYRDRIPFSLRVVHINHGIREEASEDAAYVQKLCETYEVPFSVYQYNIPELSKEWGMSEEEAGRKARYEAFQQEADKIGVPNSKIAVAHHRNDLAETVLFQMFRGSGLKGLAGIQPVNGSIIRPLLGVTRKEIEKYLAKKGISYQTDQTNFSDEYTRNKIRHHILPFVEEEINEQATMNIARAASVAFEADQYFCKKATQYIENNRILHESLCLSVEKLLQLESIEIRYILYTCLEQCAGMKKDITAAHIEAVESILHTTGTKRVELPYQITVKKTYDLLFFVKEDKKQFLGKEKGKALCLEDYVSMREFPYEKKQGIPQNQYTKWFDYDRIKNECLEQHTELCIRFRQTKDLLEIDDEGHTKSLKKYMIEEKIPKETRDEMPILAIGSHVVWIPGYRISSRYKVSQDTRTILEIQFKEEEDHG